MLNRRRLRHVLLASISVRAAAAAGRGRTLGGRRDVSIDLTLEAGRRRRRERHARHSQRRQPQPVRGAARHRDADAARAGWSPAINPLDSSARSPSARAAEKDAIVTNAGTLDCHLDDGIDHRPRRRLTAQRSPRRRRRRIDAAAGRCLHSANDLQGGSGRRRQHHGHRHADLGVGRSAPPEFEWRLYTASAGRGARLQAERHPDRLTACAGFNSRTLVFGNVVVEGIIKAALSPSPTPAPPVATSPAESSSRVPQSIADHRTAPCASSTNCRRLPPLSRPTPTSPLHPGQTTQLEVQFAPTNTTQLPLGPNDYLYRSRPAIATSGRRRGVHLRGIPAE